MHYTTLAIASLSAIALAQTTASGTSDSACAAQNIVDACKATIQAQVDSCQANDWSCYCTQYTNLLTCYNNCPGDAERSSVNNQVIQYCAAASQYATSTTVLATTAHATASESTANVATSVSAGTTPAKTSASGTTTPNAAPVLEISGSLAAIVLAGLGLIA